MNNIRFIKPVYPGDELYTLVKVTELREKRNETVYNCFTNNV